MYNYQRKSFDYKANTYLPEEDSHHKQLGVTSPFNNPHMENKKSYLTNDKKYSYQNQLEQCGFSRPRTPSAGGFNKNKESTFFYEGEVPQNKFKRITKNYTTGIGNQSYFDGDDIQKVRNKKGCRYDDSSYLLQDKEEERHNFQRNSVGRRQQNKENYSMMNQTSFNDDSIHESFQKINEQEILKKIGRINKLNQEINGRLQKILVKVTTSD